MYVYMYVSYDEGAYVLYDEGVYVLYDEGVYVCMYTDNIPKWDSIPK